MSLPSVFSGRLRIPAIGAPLFVISNPELTIAQCTAGIVGAFPALNARPASMLDEWLHRVTGGARRVGPCAPETAFGALRGEPNCASEQRSAGRRSGVVREVESAGDYYIAQGARGRKSMRYTAIAASRCTPALSTTGSRIRPSRKGADGLIASRGGRGRACGDSFPFLRLCKRSANGLTGRWRFQVRSQPAGRYSPRWRWGRIWRISVRHSSPRRKRGCGRGAYKRMIVESSGEDIIYTNFFTGVHGNYLKASVSQAGFDPENLPRGETSKMNFCTPDGSEKGKEGVARYLGLQPGGSGAVHDIPEAGEPDCAFGSGICGGEGRTGGEGLRRKS